VNEKCPATKIAFVDSARPEFELKLTSLIGYLSSLFKTRFPEARTNLNSIGWRRRNFAATA
jgi:hypothetical protein